jgi:hypothetical protein
MHYTTLRAYALTLPEASEAPHHQYHSFRVGGKIFATVPPDHAAIHLFPTETDREQAFALYPDCVEPLLWGGKVVGLRLQLAAVTPPVAKALLRQSWRHKAPHRLQSASLA